VANTYKVEAIRAAAGGYATFVLENQAALCSTSAVVQAALLGAFLTGGKVDVETEEETTFVKRINAFEAGKGPSPYPSEYLVNRVATQRGPDGVDHLEAFLMKPNDTADTAYNVFDPLFQQLLLAAFTHPRGSAHLGLRVDIRDKEIVGVALGKPGA
jgi:hypothetical protein